jgi:putative endonuclease
MSLAILRVEKVKSVASLASRAACNLHQDTAAPRRAAARSGCAAPAVLLGPRTAPEVTAAVHARLAAVPRFRSDAVRALEVLLTASPEFFGDRGADSKDASTWREKSQAWLVDTFGQDNVLSIVLNKAPLAQELKALVVPIHDGRLRAIHWLDGPKKLADLQTSYASAVSPAGLQRITMRSRRPAARPEPPTRRLATIEGHVAAVEHRLAEAERLLAEQENAIAQQTRVLATLNEQVAQMQALKDEIDPTARAPRAAPKPWMLYLLECDGGKGGDKLYAGITNDLVARYMAHTSGCGARFTRAFPPRRIAGVREIGGRSEALKAEYALKQVPSSQKLRILSEMGRAVDLAAIVATIEAAERHRAGVDADASDDQGAERPVERSRA